jgi:uncharacterized membrane protein
VIDWWLGGSLGAEGVVEWASSQWVIILAISAAIGAWATTWVGERPIHRRVLEALFWAAALAGVVLALAGPIWVEEQGRREPGRVAVLIDASRSMSVMEDGEPRFKQVQPILDRINDSDVDLYSFGNDLAIGMPSGYVLDGTDFEAALDALSERAAGEELAAVVLISDGLDRGPLRRRYRKEDGATPPDIPGPLTVYQVGTRGGLQDLSVTEVEVGGYAFLRTPFRIAAKLQGVGYEGETTKATLLRDGATVSQKPVRLDELGLGEVEFEVMPDKAGRFTYSVEVPVYEGDAVPSNNVSPVVVEVVRDKIRVLQVAGAPSWDVKFLRRFLKGDPSVDLVSFFILRTPRDLTGEYRDKELSLIQFPYRDLFQEDLWSFDVVIFQNFDYQPYFSYQSNELLGNIRRYVEEEGHAFVMIGGDRSFGLGKYGDTPLASVLPLTVTDQGQTTTLDTFEPQLTEVGRRHPVTRLVADSVENDVWWARLHALDGANIVQGVAPDAAVLLVHPTLKMANGEALPILAVREVGNGRSMALTVDASWRWSLSEAADGRGNQAYLRFWKNAMRWLLADPSVSRITVDTSRENYVVGDEVRIVVRARDPSFAPAPGAEVVTTITNEDGSTRMEGRTSTDGDLVLSYPAVHRGSHRVTVEVKSGLEFIGEDETVFAVTNRDPELNEVTPDESFLEWLAGVTGGRYYDSASPGPVVRDAGAGRVVFTRRETPLWRAPLLALWIGLFAGLTWIVRRRAGLR